MRRPFFWPAVGLAVGILLGRAFHFPNRLVFIFVFSLLPPLWAFRGRRFFLALLLLALIGVGILRVRQAFQISTHDISNFASGDWTSVEGRVISLPELKEKGRRKIYSFVLESKNLVRERKFSQTHGKIQVFVFNPSREPVAGSRVRLRGKLIRPKKALNPGEFDYQKHLENQGIRAVFEGYGPRSVQILENPLRRMFPFLVIQDLRLVFARRIDSQFSYPTHAILRALVLGMRKGLPEELRDDLMKTGTTHILPTANRRIFDNSFASYSASAAILQVP